MKISQWVIYCKLDWENVKTKMLPWHIFRKCPKLPKFILFEQGVNINSETLLFMVITVDLSQIIITKPWIMKILAEKFYLKLKMWCKTIFQCLVLYLICQITSETVQKNSEKEIVAFIMHIHCSNQQHPTCIQFQSDLFDEFQEFVE